VQNIGIHSENWKSDGLQGFCRIAFGALETSGGLRWHHKKTPTEVGVFPG
jgi:hypothetical protein